MTPSPRTRPSDTFVDLERPVRGRDRSFTAMIAAALAFGFVYLLAARYEWIATNATVSVTTDGARFYASWEYLFAAAAGTIAITTFLLCWLATRRSRSSGGAMLCAGLAIATVGFYPLLLIVSLVA